MKILFLGTDEFAVPSLKALSEKHQVVAVVTRPDKPRGRGRKVSPTAVKLEADRLGIPVMEPLSLKSSSFREALGRLDFEIVVLVAYGKLLPEEFLDHPSRGCICLHPSKLPQYRGCSPIESAILDGVSVTGISVFHIDKDFDTGDVIYQKDVEIDQCDSGGSLRKRMSFISPEALLEALDSIEKNRAVPLRQNPDEAKWAPKITREDAHINWEQNACACRNRIRAFDPKPGAYGMFRDKVLKILESAVVEDPEGSRQYPAGTIVALEKNKGLLVSCGQGTLLLSRVQPQGKAPMDGWAFVLGYRPEVGERLT